LGSEEKERRKEIEATMRVAIIPGLVELRIKINPKGAVTRKGLPYIVMPWMFAPWPENREKGVMEIAIRGETLRELLVELSNQYKQANVDFEPVNPKTNDVDFDYDVSVNGKNYIRLSKGLDTKLRSGNEVIIKMNWRWNG